MANTKIHTKGLREMSNKKKDKNVTKQVKKAINDAKKAGVKLVKVQIR